MLVSIIFVLINLFKHLVLFMANKMNVYSIDSVVDSELYDVKEISRLYNLFDVSN